MHSPASLATPARETMPDYYAILWRALEKGNFASAQWRDNVFQQTRQMLLAQLRSGQPPLSNAEIRLHTDALEAAIKTIQSEFAQNRGPRPGHERALRQKTARAREPSIITDAGPRAAPFSLRQIVWVGVAVIVAAIAAGAYAFVTSRHSTPAPPASKVEAANDRAAPQPPPKSRAVAATSSDGDLAPGIDGGSTDADVPFFFRRQPVFYRTTHPPGTIIVDKQQHFLYLIQPNQVALRYGIGVGKPCTGVAGLRKITGKAEWPPWQAPADMVERKLAPAGIMQGGPGNPLGARLIDLDDGTTRIHGTNAPKTIGNSVNSGCIRLVNDDIVDLYNRVSTGARVIFSD
jgi:lipoprotein-anchoring transpeptidase ErfK/SrfK